MIVIVSIISAIIAIVIFKSFKRKAKIYYFRYDNAVSKVQSGEKGSIIGEAYSRLNVMSNEITDPSKAVCIRRGYSLGFIDEMYRRESPVDSVGFFMLEQQASKNEISNAMASYAGDIYKCLPSTRIVVYALNDEAKNDFTVGKKEFPIFDDFVNSLVKEYLSRNGETDLDTLCDEALGDYIRNLNMYVHNDILGVSISKIEQITGNPVKLAGQ